LERAKSKEIFVNKEVQARNSKASSRRSILYGGGKDTWHAKAHIDELGKQP